MLKTNMRSVAFIFDHVKAIHDVQLYWPRDCFLWTKTNENDALFLRKVRVTITPLMQQQQQQ